MTDDQESNYFNWALLGALALPLAGITYVFGFWVDLGGDSSRLFSLGFPPTLLVSCMSLAHFYGRGTMGPFLQIAMFCAALAAATFLMMITVQAALHASLVGEYQALEQGAERTAALWALRAIDQTQLAFDIAWDVWISLATVAFGIGMINRHSSGFERLGGLLGIAAGTVGLAINLFTFPRPPSELGLPDPGIFFFIWFSFVAIGLLATTLKGRTGVLARLSA